MLFVLGFVVGSVNSLIEALFFQVLTLREVVGAAVPAATIFGVLSPLAVLLSGLMVTGFAGATSAGPRQPE